jgi:hypothetical protein
MRAGDRLENCVFAVKRAGRYWYRAVKNFGSDPEIFDELFLPLKELRDKIEHSDKDLFAEGEPLFVTVLPESVYLNDA